jgi:protein-S-isoprenylcysteine O-methyltransferase Ste14
MLGAFFFLFRNDPALLEKRMKTKEREKEQRVFVLISGLTLIAGFLLPGFDERFSWSSVPLWLVIPATAVMVGGYLLFMTVMKQNSYASRVVEVQEEQRVITTGVYSVVRHPMYLAATLIFVSAPFVLDSFWALIPLGLFSFLFVFRIKNEEEVLKKGLPGYEDYMRRVRYRLIPYIW